MALAALIVLLMPIDDDDAWCLSAACNDGELVIILVISSANLIGLFSLRHQRLSCPWHVFLT